MPYCIWKFSQLYGKAPLQVDRWQGSPAPYTDINFFPEADQFDTFVDLFFGGGAVTMWVAEMYPDKKLIINDLNSGDDEYASADS